MLETPHVAVGIAIASKISNPLLSIPLVFLSHFVLDATPHWNPHLNTETKKFGRPTYTSTVIVVIDCLFALGLGIYFSIQALPNIFNSLTILFAGLVSVLPDLVEAPYFYLNFRNKFLEKWISFQKSIQNDVSPFWGLLTQVLTVIASIYFIYT